MISDESSLIHVMPLHKDREENSGGGRNRELYISTPRAGNPRLAANWNHNKIRKASLTYSLYKFVQLTVWLQDL